MNRNTLMIAALVALGAAAFGCRPSQEIHVNLPSKFAGSVVLSCNSIREVSVTGAIDTSGFGSLDSCPSKPSAVYITRDGAISRIENPQWNRTGDGILTSVSFTVQ